MQPLQPFRAARPRFREYFYITTEQLTYSYTFPFDATITDINLFCGQNAQFLPADPLFQASYRVEQRMLATTPFQSPWIQLQNAYSWTGVDIPMRERLEIRHGVKKGETLYIEIPSADITDFPQHTLGLWLDFVGGYTEREDMWVELPWVTTEALQTKAQSSLGVHGVVRALSISSRVTGTEEANRQPVEGAWGVLEMAGTSLWRHLMVRAKPLINDFAPAIMFSQAIPTIMRPNRYIGELVFEVYDPYNFLSSDVFPLEPPSYLSMQLVVDRSHAAKERRYDYTSPRGNRGIISAKRSPAKGTSPKPKGPYSFPLDPRHGRKSPKIE